MLQIKVSLNIANILNILFFHKNYRDDRMFSVFLSLGNFSKDFLLVASSSSYKEYAPKTCSVSSLNLRFSMESFL